MNGLHIASLVSLFSLFLLSLLNSLHCLPFFLFFPFLSSSSPLGFFMLNTIICQLWNTSTVTNKQFPTISSLWYYTCNRKNTQHNYSPVRQRGTELNDPKIVKIYVPHSWNAHMHICALFSMWYFIFHSSKKTNLYEVRSKRELISANLFMLWMPSTMSVNSCQLQHHIEVNANTT